MSTVDQAAVHLARSRLGADSASVARWQREGLARTSDPAAVPRTTPRDSRQHSAGTTDAVTRSGGTARTMMRAGTSGVTGAFGVARFAVRGSRWAAVTSSRALHLDAAVSHLPLVHR